MDKWLMIFSTITGTAYVEQNSINVPASPPCLMEEQRPRNSPYRLQHEGPAEEEPCPYLEPNEPVPPQQARKSLSPRSLIRGEF